jgi:hypothetical protein
MALSADVPTPAAGLGAPAAKAPKHSNGRAIRFPFQLRIHITPAMTASLARISKRMLMAEGVVGRWALIQFLASNDPEYREE